MFGEMRQSRRAQLVGEDNDVRDPELLQIRQRVAFRKRGERCAVRL